MKENNKEQIGRKPMLDPAEIRYTIRFNEEENVQLLNKMDMVMEANKTRFIKACVF